MAIRAAGGTDAGARALALETMSSDGVMSLSCSEVGGRPSANASSDEKPLYELTRSHLRCLSGAPKRHGACPGAFKSQLSFSSSENAASDRTSAAVLKPKVTDELMRRKNKYETCRWTDLYK